MRNALRLLCWPSLIWAVLACGDDPAGPCSAADAAAGRCQPEAEAPAAGIDRPDWSERLCEDWQRLDGSCDRELLASDYEECLSEKGLPEQQRMLAQGAGNRAVNRSRDRATYLCLELRRWVMTPEGRERWLGRPRPSPPLP